MSDTTTSNRIRAAFQYANNIVARSNVSDGVSEDDLTLATDTLAIVKRIMKIRKELKDAAVLYKGPNRFGVENTENYLCSAMRDAQYIVETHNISDDVTTEHLSMAKEVLNDIRSLAKMAYWLQETETIKTITDENPYNLLSKQFGVKESCAQQ